MIEMILRTPHSKDLNGVFFSILTDVHLFDMSDDFFIE